VPDYSIFVMAESDILLSGDTVLDGVNQGDGSHLVGEFLTITTTTTTEIFVTDNDTDFDDNDGNQLLNGTQTFDEAIYTDGTRIEAEYQFVVQDDLTGEQYTLVGINFNNSSPAFGTVEGIAFVGTLPPVGTSLRIISASEGPGSGSQPPFDETLLIPYCLTQGTLVMTDMGAKPAETLVPGDRVTRASGGSAVLRRVLTSRVSCDDISQNAKLSPIRITAGALGCGLPTRDLLVSRQHRMLVSSRIAERMFGTYEVLVAAIKLTDLPGIDVDTDVSDVTYIHLVFDRHEVILAEGAPTESLFMGLEAVKQIPEDAREEMFMLFPELRDTATPQRPACYIPSTRRQKRLIERHMKNNQALLDPKTMSISAPDHTTDA